MSCIKYILMDVDGTMTDYLNPGTPMSEFSPLTHLENLVMKKHGISREEAFRRISVCGDMEVQCLSEFLPMLDVDPSDYFNVMAEDFKKFIYIPDDTIRFLHDLKDKRIALYTATTNSSFITRVKLSLGNIADLESCPLLTGYCPGCMFRDPLGKYSPSYYPNILKHYGFDPETVMMIGDEPAHDMLPALQTGIRYGITIDRKQKQKWFFKEGGIYVNSLDILTELMKFDRFFDEIGVPIQIHIS